MKKRIFCLALALLMLVGMLPVGVFAEGKTEYEKNETGTAVFNDDLLGQVAYITNDPTLGLDASGDYTITVDKALLSQTFYIADSYVGERGYWYKLEPLDGETMPAKMSAKPWVYQNDITSSGYADALIITPPANTCRCCESCTGAEDCECGCGECDYCEPTETDPTTPSTPENPCKCCENCTGAEDCACGCGECQFCEPTETDPTTPSTPENPCKCCENCTGAEDCQCECGNCQFCETEIPDLPILTDPETNVEVTIETLPEGVNLEVDPDADVSAQFSDFGIPAANQVFGLDITLTQGGVEYQPGGAYIKVPVGETIPVGTMIGIIHKHGNEVATFMGLTKVLSDHTVEFYTDSFSEFAGFTVDFHYEGVDYSIAGLSSIKLSELFTAMKIPEDAYSATSVVFSNNDLVTTERLSDGDWLLTSKAAFQTEETLIVTFTNRSIVIDVTDDDNDHVHGTDLYYHYLFRSTGQASGDDLINERNGTYGFICRYGHILGGGAYSIQHRYYDSAGNHKETVTGNHYYNLSDLGTKYKTENNTLWFYLFDSNRVEISKDPSSQSWQLRAKTNGSGDRYISVRGYSTAINLTQSQSYCSLQIDSRFATSTETRHIKVYLNGDLVGYADNVLFPNRNQTDNKFDQHNALRMSYDTDKYSAKMTSLSYGGSVPYSYDTSTKTYKIELTSLHTVTWKNHDGSILETDTKVAYGSSPSYDGATPTRTATAEYTYTFTGWSPTVSSVTGDVTYTAQFSQTKNKYTVTWKNWDGSVLETDTNVAYGTTPSYDGATPSRTATAEYTYTFTGWSPTVSSVTGDVTFTAQFSQTTNKYTVTWKNWDDSTIKTDTVIHGGSVTYSGTNPSKSVVGYTSQFTGWDKGSTISNVTADTVVTAQFTDTAITYKVSFDMNGATSTAIPTQTLTWGNSYTLLTPEKRYTVTFNYNDAEDHDGTATTTTAQASATFLGWADEGLITYDGKNYGYSGEGTNFVKFDAPYYGNKNGDVVRDWEACRGIYSKYGLLTHYLEWGQGEGRAAYGSDPGLYAGDTVVSNMSTTAGDTVLLVANWSAMGSVSLSSPERVGYSFGGWYTDAACTDENKVTETTYTPASNVTLYAKWTASTKKVTYVYSTPVPAGAPAVPNEADVNVGSEVEVADAPSLTGYTFNGWTTADVTVTDGKFTMPNKAVTFTGSWTDQYRYVLKFDANGGENAPATLTQEWKDENSHQFTWTTNPTREGYDFMGWATSADATEAKFQNSYKVTTGKPHDTEEVTLYAVWKRQTGKLELIFDGDNTKPAIVTVTGQGKSITVVLTKKKTVIKDLPTGEYTVTAESGRATYTASVDNSNPTVVKDKTVTVGVTISGGNSNWFTAFSREKNKCN